MIIMEEFLAEISRVSEEGSLCVFVNVCFICKGQTHSQFDPGVCEVLILQDVRGQVKTVDWGPLKT